MKTKNNKPNFVEYENISLNTLTRRAHLSVRAYHICLENSLNSLKSILIYHNEHPDFKSLKSCGEKTNKELLAICDKNNYIKFLIDDNNEKLTDFEDVLNEINSLSQSQREQLENYYTYLIQTLSLRANHILKLISESYNSDQIFQVIFSENFNFRNIEGSGLQLTEELDRFRSNLILLVKNIQTIQKEVSDKVFCEFIIKTARPSSESIFDELFQKMFDESGQLKIFMVVKFLIDKNLVFSRRERMLFDLLYTNNIDEQETEKIIHNEFRLCKERVRQIKIDLQENLESYLKIVGHLKDAKMVNYGILDSKPFQVIDDKLTKKINENEKTNFNSRFCNFIFGEIYGKTHSVLQQTEWLVWKRNKRRGQIYKNNYLISKTLNNALDFRAFMNDMLDLSTRRITKSYLTNLEDYLKGFLIEGANPNIEDLKYACKTILKLEFNIDVNSDGYVIFKRTSKKLLREYCYEILEKASTNMSMDQIISTMKIEHPELNYKEFSLRSTLNTYPDMFISFGRTSVYGLKKWEKEKAGIKGGSIRDMVYEYLKNENEPKHISEILQYVTKYRPNTNGKSIIDNIIIDKSSRFIVFRGNYLGLKEKKYKPEDIQIRAVNGGYFSHINLRKFQGWKFDDIVKYYYEVYYYRPLQIIHLLEKKIKEGILIIKE